MGSLEVVLVVAGALVLVAIAVALVVKARRGRPQSGGAGATPAVPPPAADSAPTETAVPPEAEPVAVAEPELQPQPVAVAEPEPEPEPVAVAQPESAPEPESAPVPAGSAGEPAAAAAGPADDLRRIEGIGPKMADALQSAGIRTFQQLADSDEATLRAAVRSAGLRAAASLPRWPERARALAVPDRG